MIQSNKDEIYKKWEPILDNIGLTGSKANWMAEYVEMHSKSESTDINENTLSDFPILPMAKRVAAQTIGLDLVTVQPIGGGNSGEQLDKIKKDIQIENRDRKIDSIIKGDEYKEMKVEEHPDYITPSGPSGQLFYMDYKYNTGKKTRRSGKKNKKKNNDI
jgi:hypothetical protein